MAIVEGFNKVQDHTRITLKHTANHKTMKNSFNSSVKFKYISTWTRLLEYKIVSHPDNNTNTYQDHHKYPLKLFSYTRFLVVFFSSFLSFTPIKNDFASKKAYFHQHISSIEKFFSRSRKKTSSGLNGTKTIP